MSSVIAKQARGSRSRGQAPSQAVLESWRRCELDRMDPSSATPRESAAIHDGRLLELVDTLAAERTSDLSQARAALILTDGDGVVLGLWGADGHLEDSLLIAGVREGVSLSEAHLGTSSVSTLIAREPMMVHGAEHFSFDWQHLTTAGAPLLHPVTRRVVGSLHVVADMEDAAPAMMSWVRELAREVGRRANDRSSHVERRLMEAFLAENRDSRHAVVAINQQTIVTNAAAARIVGVEEQTVLWEHAARVVSGEDAGPDVIQVGRGLTLRVRCVPVLHEGDVVGVVMRLKRLGDSRTPVGRPGAAHLPGLAGSGAKWQALCRRALDAGRAPLLLVGERGTGRASVARALAAEGTAVEMDALTYPEDPARWLRDLKAAAASGATDLIVQHVDELPPSVMRPVAKVIESLPAAVRVVVTSATWPGHDDQLDVILELFATTLHVPPLRDRVEDIPDLVKAITARWVQRHRHLGGIEWMSDALQALARAEWHGNVSALALVVEAVLADARRQYVGARDLPPELMARATGRRLSGLERVEAGAILQALRDAGGNKFHAAEALGIARSTLYRKMRALGVDLTAQAF